MPPTTLSPQAPPSCTKIILEALRECGAILFDALPSADELFYPHLYRSIRGIPPHYYRQTLRRFEKRGWVTRSRRDGRIFFTLTKKGALQGLCEHLVTEKHKAGRERCLVLFDIPERCRKDRDVLRKLLRSLNFEQVQKSVYIGYALSRATSDYLSLSGLEKYIRCFKIQE